MAKKKTIKIEEPVELKKAPLLRNNVPDPVPSFFSGLLRFSPDHIVRLFYDPDSKNFMLGDLTQNLVTEGVMGESGGGGVDLPKLTINLTCDNTSSAIGIKPIIIENGMLIRDSAFKEENTLNAGQSKTFDTLVMASYNLDDELVAVAEYGVSDFIECSHIVSTSNLVNCSIGDYDELIITDPSAPASIDVVAKMTGA